MFDNCNLKRTYTTTEEDVTNELNVPLLSSAVRYDRVVGFFSSSWLKEVASGLAIFAKNGGKARISTSVILSEHDWKAIQDGNDGKIQSLIETQVFNTIEELKHNLETQTLATLSWMIRENILEFRFGVPIGRLDDGYLHTKLAIYYDENNKGVVVFGSQNDSHQATINDETLTVFTNWAFGQDYFNDYVKLFDNKWNGIPSTLKTYSITEAAKDKIIEAGIHYECPYKPKLVQTSNLNNSGKSKKELRGYQQEAINNWINNNYNGLFEMATGSGKTFTSISAAKQLYEKNKKLCLVVLAPLKHLVTQWAEELETFGFKPILCFDDSNKWQREAYAELQKYKSGLKDKVCFVATHKTATLEPFKEFIKTINKDWMLIADEVHGLGSENQACALFPTARYRIGLSATPQRWYDEVGTKRLFDYFDKTVIEFDLERAIKGDENGENKVLTPYEYEPILIEFSEEELSIFEDLTHKIGLIAMKKNKTQDDLDKLEKLCRDRARVIGKAENKLPTLIELVRQHKTEVELSGEKYIHNLYYCAPGEHKEVLSELSNLGIKVHEFVSGVKQRKEILEAFANGDIEGLVAIKCLDEGVDVPATKRAYILASSTNPKEFIQRRGRVLRLSPKTGKYKAYIYDFMIGPWSVDRYNINTAQCLLKRELPRFSEFNSLNNLKYEMQNKIRYACEYFNTINEMDMKPWDVYARIMSEDYTNFM